MDFKYDWLLKEFSVLQEKMLFLEKREAKTGFKALYLQAGNHFKVLFKQHKDTKKGDEHFFIRKQSEMILRYISELELANKNIDQMSEIELIKLFEKQYKLKKIILKLKAYL